ncbi:MAG: GNAT family N-acetyltransferase [Acidobacteria bacterium]|nr:GNAT family N-acetyltransferase [Acidobacteriota bacterium]
MSIERIEDFAAFEKLRSEWNRLLEESEAPTVFLSHEWLTAWWKAFGKVANGQTAQDDAGLYVWIERDETGRLIAAAPLMKRDGIVQFMASEDVSDYADFLFLPEAGPTFFENVLNNWRERGDVFPADLINLRELSPTLNHLPAAAEQLGLNISFSVMKWAPVLRFEGAYDSYLSSLPRKTRHERRRKRRRLEDLGGIRSALLFHPDDIAPAVDRFTTLHRAAGPDKDRFWGAANMPRFFKEMLVSLAEKGWVEMLELWSNSSLLASLITFVHGRETALYNIAFDGRYSSSSPGLYLFQEAIARSLQNQRPVIDFLRGREPYKYDFGAQDTRLFRLSIPLKRNEKK